MRQLRKLRKVKRPRSGRTRRWGYPTRRNPGTPSQNALERQIDGAEKQPAPVPDVQGSLGQRFTCAGCGIGFEPNRKGQKYHSSPCRSKHWKKQNEHSATIGEPQNVLGIMLVMEGKADSIPCGFCHRMNKVDLARNGRQNALCRCGARYFCYTRKLGGHLLEQWGWKKGKERSFYL